MTQREDGQDTGVIACQQVLLPDASVFSIQWVEIPGDQGERLHPTRLLADYLRYVRRASGSLIRPVTTAAGVEFRLAGTVRSVLTFTPPSLASGADAVTLRICGGLLVQPRQCDRGQLTIRSMPVPGGTRVILELSDYCPLLLGSPAPSPWRKLFYRLTQAYIHKVVTIRFLAGLRKELAGPGGGRRVVRVRVRDGETI